MVRKMFLTASKCKQFSTFSSVIISSEPKTFTREECTMKFQNKSRNMEEKLLFFQAYTLLGKD